MLQTKRLTLKPYSESDEKRMLALLTNEQIKETFMIPDLATPEAARAMFEKLMLYSHDDAHYEKGIYKDNELIGFVNDVEIKDGCIELGYVIHPDHHNMGYATEVLSAVIDDLFGKGFAEVKAAAFEHNMASRRVMEKCGMHMTEETETISYHGKEQPCVYYVIKKES